MLETPAEASDPVEVSCPAGVLIVCAFGGSCSRETGPIT